MKTEKRLFHEFIDYVRQSCNHIKFLLLKQDINQDVTPEIAGLHNMRREINSKPDYKSI